MCALHVGAAAGGARGAVRRAQAWAHALWYSITRDERFARSAVAIVLAWCEACTACTGDNRQLEAAWSQCCFARALELLKAEWPGIAATGALPRYLAWFDRVMAPALRAPITWKINGGDAASNWHAAVAEALMQVAVLRDDARAFDAAVAEFRRILPIIIKPSGFGNEVLRDLKHAQMAQGSLLQICEIAWAARGLDLYREAGDRLAAGMEYLAAALLVRRAGLVEVAGKDLKEAEWMPQGAWELGVMAYELLSGRLPHEADNLGELLRRVAREPVQGLEAVRPGTSPALSALVGRLLARARNERPDSAAAVAAELAALRRVAGAGSRLSPPSRPSHEAGS